MKRYGDADKSVLGTLKWATKRVFGMKQNPEEYERLRRAIELQEEEEVLESSDSRGGDRIELNPASGGEAEARWYNLIFFSWINPLLAVGRTRPLFMRDLGTLLPDLHPAKCSEELDLAWRTEIEEKETELSNREFDFSNGKLDDGKLENSISSRYSRLDDSVEHDGAVELLEEDNGVATSTNYTNFSVYENSSSEGGNSSSKPRHASSQKSGNTGKPSLQSVLIKTYRRRLFWITLPRMWRVTAGFSGPLIVQQLIQVIENPNDHAWYYGLMWAFLLFMDVFFAALIFQHFCHFSVRCEVSLKMALNSLVYGKLLRLSAASKQESNIQGRLLSLVSSDTHKVTEMIWQLPVFLLAPILSLVSFFTVSYLLSFLSALSGFATLIILAPLTLLVAKRVDTLRQRQSALSDTRIRLSTDIFHSMKTVKLYALEEELKKKTEAARNEEIRALRSLQIYKALARALYEGIIPIMFLTTVVTFVLKGGNLTPSNAFAVVSVYAALYWPFLLITGSVSATVEALISIKRFEEFLALDEQKNEMESNNLNSIDAHDLVGLDSADLNPLKANVASLSSAIAITFQDASFKWSSASPDVLKGINLQIRKKRLTCIVGPVGSGKTSLLNAILGELKLSQGNASLNLPSGPIAYCPQTPFLMHMSIRDNILFGSIYDEERYNRVIKVCQLEVDLRHLVEGDHTVVGERGITLSGGQRSRVSMARAAYSKAELLLLDDPLSSLDTHVGSLLLYQCIKDFLKDRTVILVTHQLQYAAHADEVVIFGSKPSGTISSVGSPSLLSKSGIDLTSLLSQFNTDYLQKHGPKSTEEDEEIEKMDAIRSNVAMDEAEPLDALPSSITSPQPEKIISSHQYDPQESFSSYSEFARSLSTEKGSIKNGETGNLNHLPPAPSFPSDRSSFRDSVSSYDEEKRSAMKANRIAKEARGSGGIGESVYKFYFRHFPLVWIIAVILAVAHRAAGMWVQLYVGQWSAENAAVNQTPTASPAPLVPGTPSPVSSATPTVHSWESTKRFLIIFTISSLAVISVHLIKSMTVLILSVMTSKAIYREMEDRMIRGVMAFYDVTPKGRISSRLSSDTDALDSKLGEPLVSVLNQMMIGIAAWIVAAIAVRWFALMFVPVTIGYIAVFNRSIDSFRDLTRLDGNAKSPVAGLIEETNTGLISIRSYRRQSQLISHLYQLLDQHARPFYYKYVCDRWLALRLSLVSAISGATIGMVGVINSKLWFKNTQAASNTPTATVPSGILTPSAESHIKDIGFVAAGLSSFLMAADVVADFMRSYTKLEAGMNSVERMEQYTKIEVERPFRTVDIETNQASKKKRLRASIETSSDIPPRKSNLKVERESIRMVDLKEVELDEVSNEEENGENGESRSLDFSSASSASSTSSSASSFNHSHRASLYNPNNPYQEFASFPSSDQYQPFKGISVLDVGRAVGSEWPSQGTVDFSNVSVRYRPGLPFALKNVSFKVRKGEKVGVVGRTGAGKSSLFSALLSLAPLDSGNISIDGVDIDVIGVGDLRSKIAIISQEPVVFAASVRFNIDPFGSHSDAHLWSCLKKVHLDDHIASLPLQLDQPLSAADEGSGGSGGGAGGLDSNTLGPRAFASNKKTAFPILNGTATATTLSYGQRQLLCVARALLKNARILLLDEASSSIDLESDALLQNTLRSDFSHCTIITIAHRLETVLDSDRVLVMEGGRVAEFDSPSALLSNPSSLFYALHAHSALSQSSPSAEKP